MHQSIVIVRPTHQAVQLRNRALGAGLADVPDFHAALAAGVHVLSGVRDRDRADHLAVAQGVNLPRVPGNPWADQRVRGKRDRLHLTVGAHVERVGPRRSGV